ncbi:MAG TPA: lytic murein transglycosylase B [Burkholderiales bacterium]|nr:lytic murein transglycosylase B [Burkholderiales bacterium]
MKRLLVFGLAALLVMPAGHAKPPAPPGAAVYGKREDVRAFVREMVARHAFVERELNFLFSRARREPAILAAIAPPKDAPARSWLAYRSRFVTESRIAEGAEFWRRNAAALERAAREHGVPEEIIVAIIGVETVYGRQMGSWRVIDALSTLAFDYPPRAEFFRGELEQYLLYAREQDIDVFSVKGSYAGAIGIPQFMPGSYRRYAVDFDGSGEADLRASPSDAIGSVANFLDKHGWQRGERVQLPARVTGDAHRPLLEAGVEPTTSLADLKRYGVETRTDLPLATPVSLIELESPGAPSEYRLGLRNFYVLTRYNRSVLYASTVCDLAQEIKARR